jgi:4-hydroxybenzoate polyprenyltransferase
VSPHAATVHTDLRPSGWVAHLPAWLRAYALLGRFDRPIGAWLLYLPGLWAIALGGKGLRMFVLALLFLAGAFAMRAAGCVVNDLWDRDLDRQVARTAARPLAAGRVTPRETLAVFGVLLLLSFVLVLFTNRLTVELAFVGAALAALYPFTKRWTHLPQVVLGAAFGWSIPMAFAAVQGTVPPLGWLLFIANILWSVIYDTEYAMGDREDDLKAGAKSTAILFGDADLPILAVLMGTLLLALVLIGHRAGLVWPYWLALLAGAVHFLWQLWLIRDRKPSACLAAFRHNNGWGLMIWAGIALALALRPAAG